MNVSRNQQPSVRTTMDPHNIQRDAGNQQKPRRTTSGTPGTSGGGETPGSATLPEASRKPQYLGGFTMFPPNESRRSKMTAMAQKEEQDLQRWKEEHRPPAVHETPGKLGGQATLAAAREKQHAELNRAKLQRKIKREESDKRRRQEEEQRNQDMKAEQRRKAELLEEKRRQEEQRRSERLRQDQARATQRFLRRLEDSASGQLASGSATATPSTSEAEESKQMSAQLEHRRVNSAFLDKLAAGMSGKRERDLNPEPQQSGGDRTREAEPQYDWSLMKLMSGFPDYSRVFLEDILDQCQGDYQQAYALLDATAN